MLAGIAGAFIAVPVVAFAAQIGNFYRTRDDQPGGGGNTRMPPSTT